MICLNVDGSLLGSLNSVGYGGLMRNHNIEFISRFYGTTSIKSILFAEIMAVLHGLTICWENGYRKINCLSDSLQAVNLIRSGVSPHHRFANEILSIRQLITRDWEVVLSHTLQEGNSCVDVLAKMGAIANTPLVKTSTPPRTLAKPLFEDANGVIFTRE
jgi:ribonuclease HI